MNFQIGDVLNTKGPVKYSFSNITGWIFKLGVYHYQNSMFKNIKERESLWSTHSRIYVGGGKWLSVTTPKAKIEKTEDINWNNPYTLIRYKYSSTFNEESKQALIQLAYKINGTGYDYFQIGSMLLHSLFPNLIPSDSKFLKADGNKVVCSVGALACLIAAWKETDRLKERPGGDPINGDGIYLEEFPPAGFNYHSTFEIIESSKWFD